MAQVLIVDDHPDLREVLEKMLQMHGHTVESCSSGPAALKKVQANPYDAVVADERMAEMSGVDLVAHIRKLEQGRRIYLVVWSADPSASRSAFAAGVDEFWVKGSERMLESIEKLGEHISARQSGAKP